MPVLGAAASVTEGQVYIQVHLIPMSQLIASPAFARATLLRHSQKARKTSLGRRQMSSSSRNRALRLFRLFVC